MLKSRSLKLTQPDSSVTCRTGGCSDPHPSQKFASRGNKKALMLLSASITENLQAPPTREQLLNYFLVRDSHRRNTPPRRGRWLEESRGGCSRRRQRRAGGSGRREDFLPAPFPRCCHQANRTRRNPLALPPRCVATKGHAAARSGCSRCLSPYQECD